MTACQIALIVLSMFLVSGCEPRAPKSPSEAAGEYVYLAPGGEVEVVIMNADWTYRQELYPDITSYRSGVSPSQTNASKWEYDGSSLNFWDWLDFFGLDHAERRHPPGRIWSRIGDWRAPTRHVDAYFGISPTFNYAFLRVKNRAEGAKIIEEVFRTKESRQSVLTP